MERVILKLKIRLHIKLINDFRPDYPQENVDDDDDQNKDEIDEAELDLNKIEEDMLKLTNEDDDEDEAILNMEALSKMNNITNINKNVPEIRHEEILESTTDASEWKLEVERVLPQLKVTIKSDHKVNLDFDLDKYVLFNYYSFRIGEHTLNKCTHIKIQ